MTDWKNPFPLSELLRHPDLHESSRPSTPTIQAPGVTGPRVLVIGGGIAGAGLAYALAARATVTVLERETHCGYHATGRSAASFTETYGSPVIRRLAMASRAFLALPPPGFTASPLLIPRGTLTVARSDQLDALDAMLDDARRLVPGVHRLDGDAVLRRVPILRPGYAAAAMNEPDAMDLDVHGLHLGFLQGARRAGCQVVTGAEVAGLDRAAGGWRVRTRAGQAFQADILVNAAGAWADEVAAMAGVAPLGLQPKRRTALTIELPPGVPGQGWPLVDDVDGDFYFKPDAGALFVSPADATDSPPTDAQPDELDIAIAVDRLQRATTLQVQRVRRAWAGLRTFADDGNPVVGRDDAMDDFVWLAGQGGYGIKTSPALSRICAAALLGLPFPLGGHGLTEQSLLPHRLRHASAPAAMMEAQAS